MVFKNIREKEGYRVEVAFESLGADLLREWIEMRKNDYDFLKVDAPLITYYDKQYRPMNREAIHNRMRKYGKIVGISDMRAHCFRKSRLNNVYNETGDLSLAADLANHKSTETTRQFYTKPKSKAEVRDKIRALERKNEEENDKFNQFLKENKQKIEEITPLNPSLDKNEWNNE